MKKDGLITCDRCGIKYRSNREFGGRIKWSDGHISDPSRVTGFSLIGYRKTLLNNKDLCDRCILSLISWFDEYGATQESLLIRDMSEEKKA